MSTAAPALHTFVVSDIHLTSAEPPDPERPFWKRYKRADLFIDDQLARMFAHLRTTIDAPMELVLNGDIFDFDAVTELPEGAAPFPISWLERQRGLGPTEAKATWKIGRILDDHPIFLQMLREWLAAGHEVVFTVGNHDMELLFPATQRVILEQLGDPERVRFCEWFYVSGGDTLIEHGNQYDSYCLCVNPIFPTFRVGPEEVPRMRLPFGSYATRMLVNGMGSVNPHAEANWNVGFVDYAVFLWSHVLRHEPLLPLTWLWGAVATLLLSLRDGIYPAEQDPLRIDDQVDDIAIKARSTPRTVRALHALRVHPAFFFPWRIAKELWLDRVALFILVVAGSFQLMATLDVLGVVSASWWGFVLALLFPPFLFYSANVRSDVGNMDAAVRKRIDLISAVARVSRVVLGHSHIERHTQVGHVDLLNPGTWSPAFRDLACTEPVGRKCVVWIRPGSDGRRIATVECWNDPGFERLPITTSEPARGLLATHLGETGVAPSRSLAAGGHEPRR
jgi:UDP-2,3-diacylglucosamine pyrophosphatase LpxH